jgi:hypothetical protein
MCCLTSWFRRLSWLSGPGWSASAVGRILRFCIAGATFPLAEGRGAGRRTLVSDEPLLVFKSHIEGKNADVAIYVDRVEWAQEGRLTFTRVAAAASTLGASALKTGFRKGGSSEVIPIKSMSSVTNERDGFRQKVRVVCSGNTIDFRVGRSEADAIKALLTDLVLGRHPAQHATTEDAISAAPFAPPAPPASTDAPQPAGGLADELNKLGELRAAGILSDEEFASAKARLLNR